MELTSLLAGDARKLHLRLPVRTKMLCAAIPLASQEEFQPSVYIIRSRSRLLQSSTDVLLGSLPDLFQCRLD